MPVEGCKKEIDGLIEFSGIWPIEVTGRVNQIVVKKAVAGTRFMVSWRIHAFLPVVASFYVYVFLSIHLECAGEPG